MFWPTWKARLGLSVPRRWIGVWLCAVLAASCTASGGSDSPDGSLDLDRSVLGDAAMFFPDDMLTAPATNLRLRPARERNATVSKVIDWRGGRISATSSDGTVYALAIPKRAVAMPTEINLTPLADVEGLPFDQPPANRLGVEFGPEGLELATPAVLTVEAPRPVAPGALTMGYHEGGRFTGAVASDEQGSRITVAIDHFSGYVMVWPLTEPDWRRLARIRLDSIELEFLDNVAAMLARDKQKQMVGIETPDLLAVAAEVLPDFEKTVLAARVRAAASGCGETKQAIEAYVRYQRMTQLLGVADKESPYARPIPESLFELEMKLCWEEAFIRCRVTGDFKSLVNYLLVNYRQYLIMTGEEPTAEMKSKAQGYLKRCGHWRVTATSLVDSVKPHDPWHTTTYGLRTEFELAWEPTDNPYEFGTVGSRIEGTGKVEIDMMKATFDPPGTPPCSVELEPGVVKYEPHAKLTEVTFDQPKQEWVPGVRKPWSELAVGGYWRETGPPTLRVLSLALFVPVVASVYRPHCRITVHESGVAVHELSFVDLYEWLLGSSTGAARLQAAMIRPSDPDFIEWRESGLSPFGLRFSKGWRVCGRPPPYRACASPPFTADQSLTDTGVRGLDTHSIELDVKIEHEPR